MGNEWSLDDFAERSIPLDVPRQRPISNEYWDEHCKRVAHMSPGMQRMLFGFSVEEQVLDDGIVK